MASITVSVKTSYVSNTVNVVGTPTGSGTPADPWVVTMDAALTGNPTRGDLLRDDTSSKDYLIVEVVSSTQVTIIDKQVAGGRPSAGDDVFTEQTYTTLDGADTGIATWAAVGDDYTIEVRSSHALTVSQTLVCGTIGNAGTYKVTVPDGLWHRGVPGNGVAITLANNIQNITVNPAAGGPTIIIERLDLAGLGTDPTGQTEGLTVTNGTTVAPVTMRNCMVHGLGDPGVAGTGTCIGFRAGEGTPPVVEFENCLVYDIAGLAGYGLWVHGGESNLLRNCAAYNCKTFGLVESASIVKPTATNCWASDCGADWEGTWSGTHNASEDGTAPNTNEQTIPADVTLAVVNPEADKFGVVKGGVLFETGLDLSGSFTDDITGATRGVTWDIGPYMWIRRSASARVLDLRRGNELYIGGL